MEETDRNVMKNSLQGGCLCGDTRYELLEAPEGVDDCHCIDCRRGAGAPFVTWGGVRRNKIRLLSGDPRKIKHANRIRHFAACCGTPLFFESSADSEWVDVTICSLDDPTSYAPRFNIWTEDRLPWVGVDPAKLDYPQGSPPRA
jgi:hypothetical protein